MPFLRHALPAHERTTARLHAMPAQLLLPWRSTAVELGQLAFRTAGTGPSCWPFHSSLKRSTPLSWCRSQRRPRPSRLSVRSTSTCEERGKPFVIEGMQQAGLSKGCRPTPA